MSNLIVIITLVCKRCLHEWTPRQATVRVCPKCKSPYWDRDRKTSCQK